MAGKSFTPTLVDVAVSRLRPLHPGEHRELPAAFLESVRRAHGDIIIAAHDGAVISGLPLLRNAQAARMPEVKCVLVPTALTSPLPEELPVR